MKNKFVAFAVLTGLLCGHLYFYSESFARKNRLNKRVRVNYVMPTEFTQAMALDFQGLAADLQLLQAIFFIGDKIEKQEMVTLEDWDYFIELIDAVTDLDPYFWDPYYFASALLAWGPKNYPAAIMFLEKALKYRPDDVRIPFHLGFYYFYFLNDHEKAAEYMAIAAKKTDASPILATLASRFAYYAGNYEFSIDLLRQMLSKTRNEQIRNFYQKRLVALEGAVLLERAMARYRERFGQSPDDLKALVDEHFIDALPVEPYGGTWVVLKSGRVFSTSKFADQGAQK